MSMSCESKRLKKSSSNWLNSGNALIQQMKMQFSGVSRFYQVVQKHTLFEVT